MADYPFSFGAAGATPLFSRRRRTPLEREMGGPVSLVYGGSNVEGIPTTTRATSMPMVEGIPLAQSLVRASNYDNPDAIDFNAMSRGGLLGNQIDIEIPDEQTNLLGVPRTDYRSELAAAKRAGGLDQLSGMLMGLAMPTRRGESRLMKSMMLGKKMGQEAEAEALNRVTAGMKVDEFMRDQDLKARKSAILAGQGGQGQAASVDQQELLKNISYLPEQNQQAFLRSIDYLNKAQQFAAAGMTAEADEMMSLAKGQREAAFSGQLTPEKRTEQELASAKDFQKTEYETRYAVVNSFNEMVKQAEAGGGISDYALLIKYIKALDPNSVVREGEVTMTDQFKGFEARLNEALRKAKGQGFDPEFRRSILDSARRQALLAASEYEKAVENKSKLYALSGLRPERIIVTPTLSILDTPQNASGPLTRQDQQRIDQAMGVDLDG